MTLLSDGHSILHSVVTNIKLVSAGLRYGDCAGNTVEENSSVFSRAGSVWNFQIRFDSVRFSISSTRFRFFRFRYLHTTTMQEYPSV